MRRDPMSVSTWLAHRAPDDIHRGERAPAAQSDSRRGFAPPVL
jgi:hypothetical protein